MIDTLLAIDASGQTAGVCLMRGGGVCAEEYLKAGLTHSETLLPLIARVLQKGGASPATLGGIAVTAGPGSFTGLRIGMATAKGLAYPTGVPLAPVSTLEAAARAAGHEGTVLAALNARRGEVYWAAFETRAGRLQRLTPDAAAPAGEACAFLAGRPDEALLVGDGAEICYTEMKERGARLCPGVLKTAYGAALAALDAQSRGVFMPAEAARPVYLRLSQAERERAQKCAEKEVRHEP